MEKTIHSINEKIQDGSVHVVTADRMPAIVQELGEEGALREVDVVTTGTFGAMCSSGAFFNFGHSDPPIKMEHLWLNDVEAYGGIAAVDAFLGATEQSTTRGESYGGAHVLEDFISGNSVELRATSRGTDCYPRRNITTELQLDDLNQAVMVNPRNAYQRYNAATNTTDRTLFTYMGMLLPGCGNLTYSGAGALAPLPNDPGLRTIGSGVPIFLGGAKGMVIGEGTQHSPASGFATLMVSGDLTQMNPQFLRAATMYGYGATLYLGVGAAIPILDVDMVRSTAVTDAQIAVNVIDYGIPQRDRPALRSVTYAELKSGKVELNGEEVRTSPLSSYNRALQVATTLKTWVEKGDFTIALPVRYIDRTTKVRPLRETRRTPRVREIMDHQVVSVTEDEEIRTAAEKLLKGETNHVPVLDRTGRLVGIVTTYDVSKAVLRPDKGGLVRDIMTRRVIRTSPDEPVDIAAQKLEKNNISALPVVDSADHVIGMLTAIDLGKLFGGRWQT